MRNTQPKRISMLMLVSLLSFLGSAQTETLASNDEETMVENSPKKIGNHLFYVTKLGQKHTIGDVNLTNGSVSILDSNIILFRNHMYSSKGIFYSSFTFTGTSYNGDFYLNFMDTLGNQLTPVLIGVRNSSIVNNFDPRFATLCNDRYYINTYYNNQHCVWESDGTEAGTQIIYQSADPILVLGEREDTILIITEGASEYAFLHYSVGSSVQQYATSPIQNFFPPFTLIGQSDDHIYVRMKDSTNIYKIYRIDFQNPAALFLTGSGASASKISFSGNRFFLADTWYNGGRIYTGLMSNPQQYGPFDIVQEHQSQYDIIDTYYGDGYFRLQSLYQGIEMVRLNTDDSLELIQTNVPSIGCGVPVNVDGFNHSNLSTSRKFFTDSDGNSYTVLTNGNDTHFYMYQLNGLIEKSLFRIEHPEDVTDIFVEDGYIYWAESFSVGWSLKRKSLMDPLETQPAQKPLSETWFQQFVAIEGNGYDPYTTNLYIKESKICADGSAVVSFSMGDILQGFQFIPTESDTVLRMKGSDIVVKYDKYGQFLWANGIGQEYGLWIQDNQFAVRENGNVIIFGRFYYDAIFDADTILNPNSQTYTYLVELDGNTGEIVWKKIIYQAIFWDSFVPEGMVLDEHDNIYLAANFYGSSLYIEGEYLTSDVNKTNALFKFDPTGNIIWARSCPTPFTDDFGETSSLDYSEEFQTISLSQSQGKGYQASSCEYQNWKYYIQEWDVDGNKKSGIEIVGSDLGSLSVSTRTANNQFFGLGYFRGVLAIDNFDVESTMGSACHKTEGFNVMYDGNEGKIVSAQVLKNNAFFPLDMDNHGEFIYVLGTTATKALTLLKFTDEGHYVGYKPLNQLLDPYEFGERDASFDVEEDYILIEGLNFRKDTILNVQPLLNIYQSVSILKTTNSGWVEDNSWWQDAPYVYDEIDELLIYPNPFSDYVNVYFPGTEVGFTSYQIVDINGRLVSKGELSEIQFQTISLPQMGQGVYLITFLGNDEKLTKQLIKM